jgi:spore coat polysaccharide biosynthesis protein SpsF
MKIAIVIQSRTGSSRLPGKIMMPLAGAPLLTRMVERVRAAAAGATTGATAGATVSTDVIVATTTEPADDPVAALCAGIDTPCFRGHPTDLLDRHYQAGRAASADVVVKIPSDCPLIDPGVIERVIGFYLARVDEYDFVSNLHPATYPDGNDVEIMPMAALETAWREATLPLQREHTTPFLWDQPARFRIGNVAWETGLDYSMSHRWTIDYQADYDFIRAVYDALYTPERPIFTLADILALLERQPAIHAINASLAGVNWYRHHRGELETVQSWQTRDLEAP